MEHKGTVTLETERLLLRRLTMDDAPAMYANWASDPEVTKYLTWPPHRSVDVTRYLLDMWVKKYEDPAFYQWAIVLKDEADRGPIGSISVVEDIDAQIASAEIGYCMGKAWWRRGIMTEALGRVMAYLFDEVGVKRVCACHDVRNPHSGMVMKKCGMRYEGTLRQQGKNNQGVCDEAVYGILRDER